MRTVSAIDAAIAELEVQLKTLHAERRQVQRSWRDEIVADFDAGKEILDIVKARKLPYGSVQGVLWRAGRTEAGRMAIRQRLHAERLREAVTA